MEIKKLASTKSTFFYPTYESIEKENIIHAHLVQLNKSNGYTYPHLHQPRHVNNNLNPNIVTHLQWIESSTILTKSTDNAFRLYISPADLLQSEDEQLLVPFVRCFHNTSIQSFEVHPLSSLYSGSIPILVSSNNMPLKLVDLIPDEDGKYRLLKIFNSVNQFNEIYESFNVLKFTHNAFNFIAGGGKMLKVFDINRSSPVRNIEGIRGMVSCVTLSTSEFGYDGFYTGGFNGHLGFHDKRGKIIETAKFDTKDGNGISQILESNNGRYLFVISRNTEYIKILDLRMGLQELENYDLKLDNISFKNQRIFGDVLNNGHGLLFGSSEGEVHCFKDAELGQATNHVIDTIPGIGNGSINNIKVNPDDSNVVACGFGDRENKDCGLVICDLRSSDGT